MPKTTATTPYLTFVRWFAAEALGTMFLAAVAGIAGVAQSHFLPGSYPVLFIPFALGIVLMLVYCLFTDISGGHFNPAISFGLMAFRKITMAQFVTNLLGQIAGAWIGFRLIIELTGYEPNTPLVFTRAASLGEFIGALLLVFAVTMSVIGRVRKEQAGLVIGAAFMIGLTVATVTGGGMLNPTISAIFGGEGTTYLLMPLLGGLAGAALAVLFDDNRVNI